MEGLDSSKHRREKGWAVLERRGYLTCQRLPSSRRHVTSRTLVMGRCMEYHRRCAAQCLQPPAQPVRFRPASEVRLEPWTLPGQRQPLIMI